MKARITSVVVALAAAACGGEVDETESPVWSGTQFRDSAGIRIVENALPAEGSRLDWRLGPEPLLTIGQMEGEEPYLFERIFGATMLSDGRIVIGDDGPKELRVFDQLGNHMQTWGGVGEGPGEFRGGQLWGFRRLSGDSIMVWHYWFPELTLFGPNGEFVRRFIPESSRWDYWGDRRSHLWPLDVTRGGLILAAQDDVDNDPTDVEVWDSEGKPVASLGAHPGRERVLDRDGEADYPLMGRSPFRRAWGDLFVIGTNHRYEFRAFALDGSLLRIVRLEHVPRLPTEAHIEAAIEQSMSRVSGAEEWLAERLRRLRTHPVVDTLPAFAAYRSDALNHLWVYPYEAPGEETPGVLFTVFDPEGAVLGYFETPEMRILEIGEDYILGMVRDELEVPSVQLWPLERRP